jgi:hypothetical protein
MPTHTQHRHQDGQVQHGSVWIEPVVLLAMCQHGWSCATLRTIISRCDRNDHGLISTNFYYGDETLLLPPTTVGTTTTKHHTDCISRHDCRHAIACCLEVHHFGFKSFHAACSKRSFASRPSSETKNKGNCLWYHLARKVVQGPVTRPAVLRERVL